MRMEMYFVEYMYPYERNQTRSDANEVDLFKFECVYINMSVTLGCISLCFILTLFVIILTRTMAKLFCGSTSL